MHMYWEQCTLQKFDVIDACALSPARHVPHSVVGVVETMGKVYKAPKFFNAQLAYSHMVLHFIYSKATTRINVLLDWEEAFSELSSSAS